MDELFGRILQQISQSPDIGHPGTRISPGRLEQYMVGLVLAENVIDKIGREGHLFASLTLARMLALDQPGNHRHLAEGPAQQMRILHPIDKFVGQYIGREQRTRIIHRLQPPDCQRIIIRHKSARLQAAILHPPRDQHPQALVRIPPFKGVINAVMPLRMGEAFHQQSARRRKDRAKILHLQPFAHIIGKAPPPGPIIEHRPHPARQMGGERHPRAAVRGDHRRSGGGADDNIHILHPLHLQIHAGKGECVPRRKRGGEAFLHPPERTTVPEAYGQHLSIHDNACIQPVPCRMVGMGQTPCPILQTDNSLEPVIGAQGIAACRHKAQYPLPYLGIDPGIGQA